MCEQSQNCGEHRIYAVSPTILRFRKWLTFPLKRATVEYASLGLTGGGIGVAGIVPGQGASDTPNKALQERSSAGEGGPGAIGRKDSGQEICGAQVSQGVQLILDS